MELLALAGLPGAGKTTFARALGRAMHAPVLTVDAIEAALFRAGIDRAEPTGLAAYVVAEALARRQLELGLSVIVDAANYVEPGRAMWRALAAEADVALRWIEVVCSDEREHRRRVEARGVDIPGFHTITWADVLRRRAETDPWSDARRVIDTTEPIEANVARALASP
ncbi:MAG TPA: AAA family ATPase [Byssovorax sp.]|jgi:predicted kinase